MELTEEELLWAKERIRKVDLFSACSDQEIQELVEGMDKRNYRAGATILFQGEISSNLCLVENGSVSVVLRSGARKDKIAELGPDSYFGEISLLTPRAATATVKADSDTDILFLPGETVQALVKKNPVLADLIHTKIMERLEANRHYEHR